MRAQEQRLQDQIDAMEKQGLQSAETVLMQQKEALQRDRDAIERLGDGHDDIDGDPITGPPKTRAGIWVGPFERQVEGWVAEIHGEIARAARELSEGCALVARAHREDVRVQAGRSGRQGALMRAQAGTARRREGDAAALLERLAVAETAVGAVIQGALSEIEGAADESLRLLMEVVSGSGSGSGSDPEQRGTEGDVVLYYSAGGAQEVLRQLLRSAKAKVLCDAAEFSRDLRSVLLSCSPGVGNGLLAVTRRLATVCTNWELAVAVICPRLGPGFDNPVEQDPSAAISYAVVPLEWAELEMAELEAIASRALASLEEDCGVVVEAICAGSARAEEEMEGLAQLIAAAAEWLVQLALCARALTSTCLRGQGQLDSVKNGGQDSDTGLRIECLQQVLLMKVADLGKRIAEVAAAANRGDLASSIGAVAQGAFLEMENAFKSITLSQANSFLEGNLMGDGGFGDAGSVQSSQEVMMFGRPVYPLELPEYTGAGLTEEENVVQLQGANGVATHSFD